MSEDDKVLCGLLAALAVHPEAVVRHTAANTKDRIEAQAVEIARLREALGKIAHANVDGADIQAVGLMAYCWKDLARAALGGNDGQ